jgi:ankyrin repeat protein
MEFDDTVELRDKKRRTPLMAAAANGHLAIIEQLLSARDKHDHPRVDVNAVQTDHGASAFLLSAQGGNTTCCAVLIEANADINLATTTAGNTPCFIAAQNGHAAVISLLSKHGANLNTCKTTTGATPLFMAAQEGMVLRFWTRVCSSPMVFGFTMLPGFNVAGVEAQHPCDPKACLSGVHFFTSVAINHTETLKVTTKHAVPW